MQSLTSAPSATTHAPLRRMVIAVLVALALGLWLTVSIGTASPADAEQLAGRSWVS